MIWDVYEYNAWGTKIHLIIYESVVGMPKVLLWVFDYLAICYSQVLVLTGPVLLLFCLSLWKIHLIFLVCTIILTTILTLRTFLPWHTSFSLVLRGLQNPLCRQNCWYFNNKSVYFIQYSFFLLHKLMVWLPKFVIKGFSVKFNPSNLSLLIRSS